MDEKLSKIICGVLKINNEELAQNVNSKDIWDSMHRVEIFFAVEDEFGIQFSEDEMAEIDTPQSLGNIVLAKVK